MTFTIYPELAAALDAFRDYAFNTAKEGFQECESILAEIMEEESAIYELYYETSSYYLQSPCFIHGGAACGMEIFLIIFANFLCFFDLVLFHSATE